MSRVGLALVLELEKYAHRSFPEPSCSPKHFIIIHPMHPASLIFLIMEI